MKKKLRIAVLGIGGVGGYIGGMLAGQYSRSDIAEISFIARGENAEVIRSGGLKLVMPESELTVHPDLITENTNELGIFDLIIICVKSYSLEKAVSGLKKCVDKKTAVLPLLNGVNASERIKAIIPDAEVWNGCIYIISTLESPGMIKVGNFRPEIYFGAPLGTASALNRAAALFSEAGINAALSDNIELKVWEKFVFLSPIATLTSYLNLSMGEIINNKKHKKMLWDLINEACAIAERTQIGLGNDIARLTLQKCENLPFESTSSMYKDFQKGKETEIDSLTLYIVKMGESLHVPTPVYKQLYKKLKIRI